MAIEVRITCDACKSVPASTVMNSFNEQRFDAIALDRARRAGWTFRYTGTPLGTGGIITATCPGCAGVRKGPAKVIPLRKSISRPSPLRTR